MPKTSKRPTGEPQSPPRGHRRRSRSRRQATEVIGRYELQGRVGSGGQATVYRAYDPVLERIVAVKVLADHLSDDPQLVERFHREAKVLAQLDHPNIVQVHDSGDDGDRHYIVMELVDGKSIAQVLEAKGRFDAGLVTEIGIQAAAGLEYLHRQGILHRDVKPGNLMMTGGPADTGSGGPALVVKLTDFGIHKALGDADLTDTGQLVGTAAYIAPELVRGGNPSAATDIYALGVVLYQGLTGRLPHEGSNLVEIDKRRESGPPLSPSSVRKEISEALSEAVLGAIAPDPAKRYSSAKKLSQALRDGGGSSRPTTETRAAAAVADPDADPAQAPFDPPPEHATLPMLRPALARARKKAWREVIGLIEIVVPVVAPVLFWFALGLLVLVLFVGSVIAANSLLPVAPIAVAVVVGAGIAGLAFRAWRLGRGTPPENRAGDPDPPEAPIADRRAPFRSHTSSRRSRTCHGTTKSGQRCSHPARRGSRYCAQHDKAHREKVAAQRQRLRRRLESVWNPPRRAASWVGAQLKAHWRGLLGLGLLLGLAAFMVRVPEARAAVQGAWEDAWEESEMRLTVALAAPLAGLIYLWRRSTWTKWVLVLILVLGATAGVAYFISHSERLSPASPGTLSADAFLEPVWPQVAEFVSESRAWATAPGDEAAFDPPTTPLAPAERLEAAARRVIDKVGAARHALSTVLDRLHENGILTTGSWAYVRVPAHRYAAQYRQQLRHRPTVRELHIAAHWATTAQRTADRVVVEASKADRSEFSIDVGEFAVHATVRDKG